MDSPMQSIDNGGDGSALDDTEVVPGMESDGLADDENTRVNNVFDAFPWPEETETPPTTPPQPSKRFKRIKPQEPDSSSDEDGRSEETQRCSIPLDSSAVTLKCITIERISEETPSASSSSSENSASECVAESCHYSDTEEAQGSECSGSKDNQSKIGYEPKTYTFGEQESEPDSPEEDPDFAPQDDDSAPPSPTTIITRTKLRDAQDGSDEEMGNDSEETHLINPSSSSSSESEIEAENELNETIPLPEPEDEPNIEDVLPDPLPDPIEWPAIPILNTVQYQSYVKYVDIGIHTTSQFYLQIYVEHARTTGRIYMYPEDVLNKFRAIRVSDRTYDTDKFLFKMKEALYKEVNRILGESGTKYEFISGELFSNVFGALAKYNLLENQVVARRFVDRNLRKFSRYDELREYQKESIVFSITRKGRCLMADEYKMGKGVEAIYASAIFEREWPLLILCRTSLQEQWQSELEKWLQTNCSVSKTYDIKVLATVEECTELLSSVDKDDKPDIVILGFNLLQTLEAQNLKHYKFRVLILDESHRIKHTNTKTARAAAHLIKRAKRRFLLTSNPAFGVPRELFHQLHVIDRQAFANSELFASRYCGFEELIINGVKKYDVSRSWKTAQNLEELRMLLFGTVLIRHFRQDYFPQDKQREVIHLDFNPDTRIKKVLEALYKTYKVEHESIKNWEPDNSSKSYFKWYKKSGQAKLPMLCKYLDQEIDVKTGPKTIVYARHKFVLDGIELLFKTKSIKYVRLDHKDYITRQKKCIEFNTVKSVKVALLSMNLSDVSIDLSAAEMVIFTELFWVPDALIKNEDRAFGNHLITGGTSTEPSKSVTIKYLLAKESIQSDSNVHIDRYLWECLLGKMDILNKLGFMKEDFMRNMPESRFIPEESNSIEDLDFGHISSGNEEEDEYRPSSGEEEEDDDDDDISSGVEEESDDSDGSSSNSGSSSSSSSKRAANGSVVEVESSQEQSDTEVDTSKEAETPDNAGNAATQSGSDSSATPPPSPPTKRNIKRQHGPSVSPSSAGTGSGSGSDGDSDPNAPSTSQKLARRLTRSQAKKIKKTSREESASEDVAASSESSDPELQSSFPAQRPGRRNESRNTDESDSDVIPASGSSIDSFIVSGSSDDSGDRGHRSTRKSKTTKRKKRATRRRCWNDSDDDDSSDPDDSDEREKVIKKSAKSFMR